MSAPYVLDAIVGHARSAPGDPAVKDLSRDLDYGELAHEAGLVAAGLAARQVRPGDRVALHLPNSVDFVVAALACLWAGAIFVPLAVSDPEARLGGILDDCAPAVVVTDNAAAFPASLARHRSAAISELRAGGGAPLERVAAAGRAAYAIYTSGTTGAPKGVLIGNDAFAAAVHATAAALGAQPGTRALCVSPFHFDGSFGTLFPTLYAGGALVIRPRDALLFPRTFFNAVTGEDITLTGFSPSYLRLLLSSPQLSKLADSSFVVALGGEACSQKDIRALWAVAPRVRVFNRYGPTEAVIAVSHIEVSPDLPPDAVIPVGRPHPGVGFYLVDDTGQLITEAGQVGELYLGGDQLMDGYWGAEQLTAEVLRDDVVAGQTVYRTGDLMYQDPAGDYVYVDRADRVIKRSGVRISLIELSDVMRNLAGVSAAACVAYDDGGQLGIAAFVVTDAPLGGLDLQQAAKERLPATMIPDPIHVVAALPLTASSKLDERRLLADAGLAPLPAAARPGPARSA